MKYFKLRMLVLRIVQVLTVILVTSAVWANRGLF